MNNDNYIQSNEIGIAVEDFTYGGYAQISVPSITPFSSSSNDLSSKEVISYDCIINEDKSFIQNSKASSCNISNCFKMYVPSYLANIERSPRIEYYDNSGYLHSIEHKDFVRLDWNGKKGTKFIIAFIGGNISEAQIIGRYY